MRGEFEIITAKWAKDLTQTKLLQAAAVKNKIIAFTVAIAAAAVDAMGPSIGSASPSHSITQ